MYAAERRQELAQLAHANGNVSVAEAALQFDVTPETIRRDLDVLAKAKILTRVHGGAIPVEQMLLGDVHLTTRDATAAEQKQRIAQAAVGLIPDSLTGPVILDSGTSTSRMVALLPSGLSVLTNSVGLATLASSRDDLSVRIVAGAVRGVTLAVVGAEAVASFNSLRADIVFIGTNGLTQDLGLTTPQAEEAAVKRAMIAAAKRVVLLADSRKWGAEAGYSFAALTDVDCIVTDEAASPKMRSAIEKLGIEVVVA